MDAAKRLSDVLRIADHWQRRAGEGDLLTLMRAAVKADFPRGRFSDAPWRRQILASQLDPVYRAIIAARVHQKAPGEAAHQLVLMWFWALWPLILLADPEHGGWPRGVSKPARWCHATYDFPPGFGWSISRKKEKAA